MDQQIKSVYENHLGDLNRVLKELYKWVEWHHKVEEVFKKRNFSDQQKTENLEKAKKSLSAHQRAVGIWNKYFNNKTQFNPAEFWAKYVSDLGDKVKNKNLKEINEIYDIPSELLRIQAEEMVKKAGKNQSMVNRVETQSKSAVSKHYNYISLIEHLSRQLDIKSFYLDPAKITNKQNTYNKMYSIKA